MRKIEAGKRMSQVISINFISVVAYKAIRLSFGFEVRMKSSLREALDENFRRFQIFSRKTNN